MGYIHPKPPRPPAPTPIDEEVYSVGRDWKCEYCGGVNWSSVTTCSNCGASKTVSERIASVNPKGDDEDEIIIVSPDIPV